MLATSSNAHCQALQVPASLAPGLPSSAPFAGVARPGRLPSVCLLTKLDAAAATSHAAPAPGATPAAPPAAPPSYSPPELENERRARLCPPLAPLAQARWHSISSFLELNDVL